MGLTYDGITYRSLEEQVRYDAEQVKILKQADLTINENLQTVNENLQTEINGKLTKPTNPSAESAVTMMADGTVGTKPLSEIGCGGKSYIHKVRFKFGSSANYELIIDIPTNTIDNITVEFLRNYIQDYNVVSFNGADGNGSVSLKYESGNYDICGSVLNFTRNGVKDININGTDGLAINSQILIEL